MSLQLICGDICQIWMWFKEYDRYSCKIEKFVRKEINERNIGQDGQRFSCSRLCVLTRCGQCVTEKYFIVLFQMECFIPEYIICSWKNTLPSGIRKGPDLAWWSFPVGSALFWYVMACLPGNFVCILLVTLTYFLKTFCQLMTKFVPARCPSYSIPGAAWTLWN